MERPKQSWTSSFLAICKEFNKLMICTGNEKEKKYTMKAIKYKNDGTNKIYSSLR